MNSRSFHRRRSSDRSEERRKEERTNSSKAYQEILQKDRDKAREDARRKWLIQQQKLREHELLKQKKIEEYERRRAEALTRSNNSINHRSRSKSRSRSLDSYQRRHVNEDSNNRSRLLSQRFNNSTGSQPSTQRPKGSVKYNDEELKKVVVKIDRDIPRPSRSHDIQRDIEDHNQITLKRRQGEGVRPIFDREELKADPYEFEERRTIEAVRIIDRVDNNGRHRSVSSPRRHRSPSPHARPSTSKHHSLSSPGRYRSPSPHARPSTSKYHSMSSPGRHRSPSPRARLPSSKHRSRSREYLKNHHEEKHREPIRPKSRSRERSRKRSRSHGRSRERSYPREYHRSEREESRSEKEHRSYRRGSRERSYSRERRESSRERRLPVGSYVESVPYPVYIHPYPPRQIVYAPLPPQPREPLGREPMPPMLPPYPSRFMGPPDIYRGGPPTNP
ncbi:hypothetical protein QAD02_016171, partial [Eretmocerus hayati]